MRIIEIRKLITLSILLLFALFSHISVYADDTSLGRTPEGVFPLKEKDVIMESEEITVDLENNSVECIFVFHNTGKSKNVYMGFPGKVFDTMDSGLTQEVNLELSNFKTYIKGKELPITHENGTQNNIKTSETLKYSEFFTFNVHFKENEKVTVRNSYNFTPTYDSTGYVFSGYVLKTGAMWKGLIGTAKVTFKLGNIQPYQIEQLYPGGFAFVGNKLVWERKNFEPNYDLKLNYNIYHYSEEYFKYTTIDEVTSIKKEINSFNKIKQLAIQDELDELFNLYKKAITNRDPIMALYIRSYLPLDKIPDEQSTLGDISVESRNDGYYVNCDLLGPGAVLHQIRISHIRDGVEILDGQFNSPSCFVNLTPGIEYNITYTLTDWMERTEQQTLKYKVPEQEEVVSGSHAQPSKADSKESEPMYESIKNDSSNDSLDIPSDEPTNELVLSKKSNNLYLIIWVLAGVFLVALLTVLVITFHKEDS